MDDSGRKLYISRIPCLLGLFGRQIIRLKNRLKSRP